MAAKTGYQQYQKTQVNTASQKNLVIMLCRGAVKFLFQAEKAVIDEDIEKANDLIINCQDIIEELLVSLDVDIGGEVVKNLAALYEFMFRRLVEANAQKEVEPIREVRGLFSELLSTWSEAVSGLGPEEMKEAEKIAAQRKREAEARRKKEQASSPTAEEKTGDQGEKADPESEELTQDEPALYDRKQNEVAEEQSQEDLSPDDEQAASREGKEPGTGDNGSSTQGNGPGAAYRKSAALSRFKKQSAKDNNFSQKTGGFYAGVDLKTGDKDEGEDDKDDSKKKEKKGSSFDITIG